MRYSDEHIERWMIEKLLGSITDEENVLLEKELNNNILLQDKLAAMQLKLEHAKLQGKNVMGDTNTAWSEIEANIISNKRSISTLRIALSVAAIALFVVLGVSYFLNQPNNQSTNNSLSDFYHAKNNDTSIAIIINNKTMFIHPNHQEIMNVGNTSFNITDSTLKASLQSINKEIWCTLKVPTGKGYKIYLPDGSLIQLNAQSSILFPTSFINTKREVYITGEAYFDIAKNKSQPFIVHTIKTDVKVLGTKFNVNCYDTSRIVTSLMEGSVETTAGATPTLLSPSYEAIYNQNSFTVNHFDPTMVLSWREGIYYFDKMPLSNLINIICRWFNMQVVFQNDSLKNSLLTGAIYKAQPIEMFLQNLALTDHISYTIKDNIIYIR